MSGKINDTGSGNLAHCKYQLHGSVFQFLVLQKIIHFWKRMLRFHSIFSYFENYIVIICTIYK